MYRDSLVMRKSNNVVRYLKANRTSTVVTSNTPVMETLNVAALKVYVRSLIRSWQS